MRIPRIHHPGPLPAGRRLELEPTAANHVTRVLRLRPGSPLVLFDGAGNEFDATLEEAHRRAVVVSVGAARAAIAESPLKVTLAQGISRGERMDYTIQKAVELGVERIVPVVTERTVVSLSDERADKRLQHWHGVLVAACEQSGRAHLPRLSPIVTLERWLEAGPDGLGLVLDPRAADGVDALERPAAVTLLIGPEGGLADHERADAYARGYRGARLGPRILRTETAALAALAVLQYRWGDLG